MSTLSKPQITAVDLSQAQAALPELIERCNKGEEIIITQAGRPVAMLASLENIQVLSNVGAASFELPFDEGGFGWMGPSDDSEAKRKADKVYEEQFR